MKRMDDMTVLVTGSTDGIGKRTALGLAGLGARVLVHGRDEAKVVATVSDIGKTVGSGRLKGFAADLSSLAEVRRLASAVAMEDRLDVLINNAGIGSGRRGRERRQVSADGYELRFAVNYLAPFLLTRLLIPLLKRSAPSRIVNVSSLGQAPIDLGDIMLERNYDGWEAYAQSKLALVMLTFDLAEELRDAGVTVNALHPGSLLDTKLVREAFGRGRGSAQEGADAVIHLATSSQLDGVTGRFYDQYREVRADPQAYDRGVREALRRYSLRLTGLKGDLPDAVEQRAGRVLPR